MNKLEYFFYWIQGKARQKESQLHQEDELDVILTKAKRLRKKYTEMTLGHAVYEAACSAGYKVQVNKVFGTTHDPYYADSNLYRFFYKVVGPYAARAFLKTDLGYRLSIKYSTFTN